MERNPQHGYDPLTDPRSQHTPDYPTVPPQPVGHIGYSPQQDSYADHLTQQGFRPVQPKPKRKKWPWVLAAVVLVFALCGIGAVGILGLGAKAINDEVTATNNDVSLVAGSCKATEFGWEAKVKITNSGTSNRSYWVQVNLENGATRLDEAHAIVNDLGPGKTVTETATGSQDMVKGASCLVGDVN